MKLVKEDIKLNRISIIPENPDDLYIIYNTLSKGDRVIAKTSRKVKKGQTGSETSVRIIVTMEIEMLEAEFHGFGETIRIKGLIVSASDENISLGTHHSITLGLNKPFTIVKDQWTRSEIHMIKEAQLGRPTGLILLVIDDEGAIISQVGSHASKILLELKPTITRKGSDPNQYQKSLQELFDELIKFLGDIKKEGKLEKLVIGGPGFIHDSFMNELKSKSPSIGNQSLNVAINNSGRNGISEILIHHLPDKYIEGNSAKLQAELLQQALEHLGKNTGLVTYAEDVFRAVEIGAIEHLLVLDTELRSSVDRRNKIHSLMDEVRLSRGKVTIMSTAHDSGKIVEGMGKLIAILRYRLPK